MTQTRGTGTTDDVGLVPPWLANLAALSWRLLVVTSLLGVAWFLLSLLATVTAAVAVAVVVSAVLVPATRHLRAMGRSRSAAAGIVWAAGMGAVTLLLVVLAIAFLPYIVSVIEETQASAADLQADIAALGLPPVTGDLVAGLAGVVGSVVSGVLSNAFASAAGVVTSLVLATFLVFFLLRDGDRAWAWCLQAMPVEKQAHMTGAGEEALSRVGGYLVGTTVLSAIVALTDLVFMVLLGVPLAVPLSLLVFLAGYIPYFGGILTTLIVLVVTYGSLGTTAAVIMLGLIAVRNVFMAYAIRPSVYGRSVSLHPALVLIALPAGFQVAGIIGLFAAVPLLAVVLAVASAVVEVLEPDDPPELPGLVPAWLDRIAQWSWRLLAGLGLVALMVVMVVTVPLVVVPVVLGVILAATFSPIVRWLQLRGRARGKAIGLALGGTLLIVFVLLLLAVGVLTQEAVRLADGVVEGAQRTDAASGGNLALLVEAIRQIGAEGSYAIAAVAQDIASAVVVAVLATLLSFYFLRDGDRLWAHLMGHVRGGQAAEVQATGTRAFEVLGGYMYGTAAISFVGAASQLVIMVLLGIPLALPVFVLSFFLCFIPYVGGFISTGVALLLTIATGSPTDIAIMALWTLVFNIVTGNVVSPIVYGKTVHLHPAIVLLAIPIGSTIAGILGMLLVVPALGVVAVSWRTVLNVMATDAAVADGAATATAGAIVDAAVADGADAAAGPAGEAALAAGAGADAG